jgi:hypothetical protein
MKIHQMRNQTLKTTPPIQGAIDLPLNTDEPFEWRAPDLNDGGEWREASLNKLSNIAQVWHDQDDVMLEGRRLLASHHLNYTSQGAQHLESLCWEWPPEHWESLRFWVSMNLLITPTHGWKIMEIRLRVSSRLKLLL